MSNGSTPPSSDPPPSDRLWVVDIVAPLPPGRVRLVAADAAARLALPAEKLVALLENRIGPVTKPLPRPSADRVAEVLNTSGAEVEVRTARKSDGPPSAARAAAAATPPPPGVPRRRAEDARWDELESTTPAPGAATDERASVDLGDAPGQAEADDAPAATPTAAAHAEGDSPKAASRDAASDEAPPPAPRPAGPDAHPAVDHEPDHLEGDGDFPVADAAGPETPFEMPANEHGEPDGAGSSDPLPPASAPSVPAPRSSVASDLEAGVVSSDHRTPPAPGREERDRATAGDPWSAMGESVAGRHDDEAMLGQWRQVAPRAGRTAAGGRGSESADQERRERARPPAGEIAAPRLPTRASPEAPVERSPEGSGRAAQGEAPRPERGAPTTRSQVTGSVPGSSAGSARGSGASTRPTPRPGGEFRRATGTAQDAAQADAIRSEAGEPAVAGEGREEVRVTPVDGVSTAPGARRPGTQGVQVRVPQRRHETHTPEADDEDEGFGFGMRDPFAEAERRERAMRRWILGVALVVAAALFLILQWAYSRSAVDDRVPPSFEVGLADYRRGAFVSAARAWGPRAEAGDAPSMYMLGYMAEIGQGRPWSNREAAGWYLQAAERGHVDAQLRLAALYRAGMGVDHDPEAALDWTLRAARSGSAKGQLEAARLLSAAGRHHEAAEWLREAADREPEAAGWLGVAGAVNGLNPRSE